MNLNPTIQDLKTVVLEHVSADWVRDNFGKLTLKSTWQAAYDRLSESIANKVDQATDAAAGYAWGKVAPQPKTQDERLSRSHRPGFLRLLGNHWRMQ